MPPISGRDAGLGKQVEDQRVRVGEISPLLSSGSKSQLEKIFRARPPSGPRGEDKAPGHPTNRYKVQGPTHPFLHKLDEENKVLREQPSQLTPLTPRAPPTHYDTFSHPIQARRIIGPFYTQTFPIYVETLTGTVFEVTCSPFEPLLSIKEKIYRLEGIPVSRQHLVYRGIELNDDEESIGSIGLQSESKLTLILDIRGGPVNTGQLQAGGSRQASDASQAIAARQLAQHLNAQVQHEYDFGDVCSDSEHEEPAQSTAPSSRAASDDDADEEDTKNLPEPLRSLSNSAKSRRYGNEQSGMIFHSCLNGNAILVVSYDRVPSDNIPNDLPPSAISDYMARDHARHAFRASHQNLVKTAANLIDDSKMNLKMRELRQKMNDKQSERRRRREKTRETSKPRKGSGKGKRRDTSSRQNSALRDGSGMRFGPTSSQAFEPFRLEQRKQRQPSASSSGLSLPPISNRGRLVPKTPAIVKHGHNEFLSKYNLMSPRQDAEKVGLLAKTSRTSTSVQASSSELSLPRQRSRTDRFTRVDGSLPPIHGAQRIISPKHGVSGVTAVAPSSPPRCKKTKKRRCKVCSKKIPLGMEFICRCTMTLCAVHRTAEAHDCTFDYKGIGRETLKKENPLVAASKLPKIE